nr:unnamed protein product [Digitaria exilis]
MHSCSSHTSLANPAVAIAAFSPVLSSASCTNTSVDSARRESGHRSGWYRSASLRNARLISTVPTDAECSSDSNL